MSTTSAVTVNTPDGRFTMLLRAGYVLASGWTDDIASLAALVNPRCGLRPTVLRWWTQPTTTSTSLPPSKQWPPTTMATSQRPAELLCTSTPAASACTPGTHCARSPLANTSRTASTRRVQVAQQRCVPRPRRAR